MALPLVIPSFLLTSPSDIVNKYTALFCLVFIGVLQPGFPICGRPPPCKVDSQCLIRSLAPICPASHEGEFRKLIFHRNFSGASVHRATWLSSKGELSIGQGAPCKPHIRREDIPPRSRIRDGRAPIGRHHSIRRRFRTRPDNGDTPLDRHAHAAPQPGLNN